MRGTGTRRRPVRGLRAAVFVACLAALGSVASTMGTAGEHARRIDATDAEQMRLTLGAEQTSATVATRPAAAATVGPARRPARTQPASATQTEPAWQAPRATKARPRGDVDAAPAPPSEPRPFSVPDPLAPPSPPAEPLQITDVEVAPTTNGVTVAWTTNFPSTSQGADAIGDTPVVWTARADDLTLDHVTAFAGLNAETSYNLTLRAVDEWGRPATTVVPVTTDESFGSTTASVDGHTIVVNGAPFFPIAVWNECTDAFAARIELGINLFMNEGCGNEDLLSDALEGRAYAVVDATTRYSAPGVIGWTYPDELDGRLSPPLTQADVQRLAITPPQGQLRFLTLTNHFYSAALPLPIGRGLYPTFASLADVLGFDLYPLQNWCKDNRFGDVYDAQRELDALAAGKPTFQWIEVRRMDCGAELSPTPATVRAETWLALAGGADGIGYFPHEWSVQVGDQIGTLDQEIAELAPALLADTVDISASAPLKASGRSLNGALYVIAVNPTQAPVDASIHVAGGAARAFDVLDENRQVTATDDSLSDHFGPLAVHVYIAAPEDGPPH